MVVTLNNNVLLTFLKLNQGIKWQFLILFYKVLLNTLLVSGKKIRGQLQFAFGTINLQENLNKKLAFVKTNQTNIIKINEIDNTDRTRRWKVLLSVLFILWILFRNIW